MNKKYKTIYADPLWNERGAGKIKRGADKHYPLMKTDEIMNMEPFITSLCHPEGCHLYLWVTNNFLEDGFKVINAWNFKYITIITWYKTGGIGLGQYIRGITEHVLFARKGSLPYKILPNGKIAQGKTGFIEQKEKHSVKPEKMRKMIELVSYPPYKELFSRRKVSGWDVWGNESEQKTYVQDKLF